MNPTQHNTPDGLTGRPATPTTPHPGSHPASTDLTSGVAGAAGAAYDDAKQKTSEGIQAVLDSGKQVLEEGKKWLHDSDLADKASELADKAKELPQKAKELSNKAIDKVSGLTTGQKTAIVGLVAAGVAFLVVRSSKKKDDGDYRLKDRRSPFAKKPHRDGDDKYGPRAQQRPWGTSRYGSAAAPAGPGPGRDHDRVRGGSGPRHEHPNHQRDHGQRPTPPAPGQRRDQGPAGGSRYDANKSGSQNPNSSDQLNSAF